MSLAYDSKIISLTLWACLASTCLAAPTWAAKGQVQEQNPKVLAAKKACSVGKVTEGIDLLGDLYVETNDPTHIHNQARCYQQNEMYDKALGRFREYLRKAPNLLAEEQKIVDRYINECEVAIAKQRGTGSVPPEEKRPVSEPIIVTTPPLADPVTPTPKSDNPGQALRTWGVATVVLGLAGVGTGVIFNIMEGDQAKRMVTDDPDYDREHSKWQTYRNVSLFSYGIGAAALITGTVLYLAGRSAANSEPDDVAFIPIILSGQTSFMLKGTY